MASLIDTLIDTLDRENTLYEKLLEIANYKTTVIVKNDIEELRRVLLSEQEFVDEAAKLEQVRVQSVKDICDVLNIRLKTVKIDDILKVLERQPGDHDRLMKVYKSLRRTLRTLVRINDNNKQLVEQNLEMIEFELNLAKNAMLAPQTANYGDHGYGNNAVQLRNSFDAKQ